MKKNKAASILPTHHTEFSFSYSLDIQFIYHNYIHQHHLYVIFPTKIHGFPKSL
jgi:hypothetical protein